MHQQLSYTHLYFAKRQQKTIKAKNKKQNNKKTTVTEQRT